MSIVTMHMMLINIFIAHTVSWGRRTHHSDKHLSCIVSIACYTCNYRGLLITQDLGLINNIKSLLFHPARIITYEWL